MLAAEPLEPAAAVVGHADVEPLPDPPCRRPRCTTTAPRTTRAENIVRGQSIRYNAVRWCSLFPIGVAVALALCDTHRQAGKLTEGAPWIDSGEKGG